MAKNGLAKIKLVLHNNEGDMTVSPTLKVLKLGDLQGVHWEVDAAGPIKIDHFNIVFPDGTPFTDMIFSDAQPQSGQVRREAKVRSYHYTVSFTAANRIFEITGCPEIIIRAN
ncbi:MAG TPA: hypothetical protein VFE90_03740 [Myxococcales bacterium]|jgi:hypothetical protein|nr:hypothetical protein [Myxococcales bacterium]